MEVLTRCKCPECDGYGRVTSAIWMEFYKADDDYSKQHNGSAMEQHEMEDWFASKGYHRIPQEEPACYGCSGNGVIEQWMNVQDVLKLNQL